MFGVAPICRGTEVLRHHDGLADAGINPSIGSLGDADDNAPAETTIGLFKIDSIRPESPATTGSRSRATPRPHEFHRGMTAVCPCSRPRRIPTQRETTYGASRAITCRVEPDSVGGVHPLFDEQPDLSEHGCELV
jgi:hypothetical protein